MNPEIKATFLNHANEIDKKNLFLIYNQILPKSTMYSWYKEYRFINCSIHYTESQLKKEWEYICKRPGGYNAISNNNKNILHFQPHFYQHERQLLQNTSIRDKILKNREKYLNKPINNITNKEILAGFKISGIFYSFSHFSPFWAKQFIQDNGSKAIYDPCGGWGHRLLGICSNPSVHYIYNDFWDKTFNGVKNIVLHHKIKNASLYNLKCEELVPSEDYDTIFTCPPYFNLEKYNNKEFVNYADFTNWWSAAVNLFLKNCVKVVGVCIDYKNKNTVSDPFLKKGLELVSELRLGSPRKMHYQKNNTDTRDCLLIFR